MYGMHVHLFLTLSPPPSSHGMPFAFPCLFEPHVAKPLNIAMMLWQIGFHTPIKVFSISQIACKCFLEFLAKYWRNEMSVQAYASRESVKMCCVHSPDVTRQPGSIEISKQNPNFLDENLNTYAQCHISILLFVAINTYISHRTWTAAELKVILLFDIVDSKTFQQRIFVIYFCLLWRQLEQRIKCNNK